MSLKTGLFWDEEPGCRIKHRIASIMPDIPDTGWKMPTEFPALDRAKVLAIDLETYDPELIEKGPGWARNRGHIVGVSVAADGYKAYYPMRHEVEKEINLPPDKVLAWLNDVLSNEHAPKIGANIMYDIGWLRQEGVDVKGSLIDVQFAEALLAEEGKTGLEHLGQKYLGMGKESPVLYDWCAKYYGGSPNDKQRKNIYRAPARLVGPYAESDATLPLQLARPLYEALKNNDLLDLFDVECRLIPLLIDMRFAGMPVDINGAEKARVQLTQMADNAAKQIRDMVGFEVNVNASASMAKAFDKVGLKYPRTEPSASYPEGQPSFTKIVLSGINHPFAQLISDRRKYLKMISSFIDGAILDAHVGGKIYPQFHPLRGDRGGTRSGRFACSNPNGQQIPSRDKFLAPLIRGLFIPQEGHEWFSADYSQIEYRMLLHFAVGQGADEIRARFNADPSLDFHDFTQALIEEKTGIKLDRKPVKNISFGLCIAEGQLVTTNRGNIPIENVSKDDLLWDGVEWVSHDGVVCNGIKDVITYHGLTTTKDHEVYYGINRSCTMDKARKSRKRLVTLCQTIGKDGFRRGYTGRGITCGRCTKVWNHKNKNNSSLQQLRKDLRTLLGQHKKRTWLCLFEEQKIFRRRRFSGITRKSIRCNSPEMRKRYAYEQSQLQGTRCKKSFLIERTLYYVGTEEIPKRRIHGDGIRPYRQRWSLLTRKFKNSHKCRKQIKYASYCIYRKAFRILSRKIPSNKVCSCNTAKFTSEEINRYRNNRKIQFVESNAPKKAKVYDIINAGPRHRFFCQGVLVSNCYGMSKQTLTKNLGLTKQKANALFEAYHTALPFVAATMDYYKNMAETKGEVRTILGRRSMFNFWVPCKYDANAIALPHSAALRKYGSNIKRAYSHKGVNRVLQGSSADQMKMAMLKMHESGVFNVLGPPLSTIHDEINISRPPGKEADEAIKEVVRIMETAIDIKVPVKVDSEQGATWGSIEAIET
jgi:DNA polymerase-1